MTSDGKAKEPYVLKLTEHILRTSDTVGASEQLDVTSILDTAVATIIGSLCAAALYPMLHSFNPANPLLWLAIAGDSAQRVD